MKAAILGLALVLLSSCAPSRTYLDVISQKHAVLSDRKGFLLHTGSGQDSLWEVALDLGCGVEMECQFSDYGPIFGVRVDGVDNGFVQTNNGRPSRLKEILQCDEIFYCALDGKTVTIIGRTYNETKQ